VKCGSPVYAGQMCDTQKQTIVNIHNDYRRRVAKGLETSVDPGPQPSAADMRKIVSEISMAVHKLLIT
jgi:hypothetical protein